MVHRDSISIDHYFLRNKAMTKQQHYRIIIDILARLVADNRVQYGYTASIDDDHVGVSVYFQRQHIATIDAAIDHSNLMECVRDIFAAHPTRTAPSYYVTTNTLGKRAVYSIAVITHSYYEDASRLKKRCSAALVAAIEAADEDVLVLTNTYSDAYMSAGKYHITNLYQFEKP